MAKSGNPGFVSLHPGYETEHKFKHKVQTVFGQYLLLNFVFCVIVVVNICSDSGRSSAASGSLC